MSNQANEVWVFHGAGGRFAGGVFASRELAEQAIARHALTGFLTRYPLDELVFDWATRSGLLNLRSDKLSALTSDEIGRFTTASQEHFHYENGALA